MNSKPVWVTKNIRPSLKIKQTLRNGAATPGLLSTYWASKQLLPNPSQGLRRASRLETSLVEVGTGEFKAFSPRYENRPYLFKLSSVSEGTQKTLKSNATW